MAAWYPSEVALYSHYECTLSQVGTRPGVTLGVASMYVTPLSRLRPRHTQPPGLSHKRETASYLTGPLVCCSGATIATVLRLVLFPKCMSSNYAATQTTHTAPAYQDGGLVRLAQSDQRRLNLAIKNDSS